MGLVEAGVVFQVHALHAGVKVRVAGVDGERGEARERVGGSDGVPPERRAEALLDEGRREVVLAHASKGDGRTVL